MTHPDLKALGAHPLASILATDFDALNDYLAVWRAPLVSSETAARLTAAGIWLDTELALEQRSDYRWVADVGDLSGGLTDHPTPVAALAHLADCLTLAAAALLEAASTCAWRPSPPLGSSIRGQAPLAVRCAHVHTVGVRCCREAGHASEHHYRCASPTCPGLPWVASLTPHHDARCSAADTYDEGGAP